MGLSSYIQAEIQGGDRKTGAVRESERYIDEERLGRSRNKARTEGGSQTKLTETGNGGGE